MILLPHQVKSELKQKVEGKIGRQELEDATAAIAEELKRALAKRAGLLEEKQLETQKKINVAVTQQISAAIEPQFEAVSEKSVAYLKRQLGVLQQDMVDEVQGKSVELDQRQAALRSDLMHEVSKKMQSQSDRVANLTTHFEDLRASLEASSEAKVSRLWHTIDQQGKRLDSVSVQMDDSNEEVANLVRAQCELVRRGMEEATNQKVLVVSKKLDVVRNHLEESNLAKHQNTAMKVSAFKKNVEDLVRSMYDRMAALEEGARIAALGVGGDAGGASPTGKSNLAGTFNRAAASDQLLPDKHSSITAEVALELPRGRPRVEELLYKSQTAVFDQLLEDARFSDKLDNVFEKARDLVMAKMDAVDTKILEATYSWEDRERARLAREDDKTKDFGRRIKDVKDKVDELAESQLEQMQGGLALANKKIVDLMLAMEQQFADVEDKITKVLRDALSKDSRGEGDSNRRNHSISPHF